MSQFSDAPTGVSRRTLLGAAAVPAVVGLAGTSRAEAATSVTRWVARPYANVFGSRSTTSGAYSRLGEAVPVVGAYADKTWFRVGSGAMAGRYVEASALTATNPASQRFSYPSPDPFTLPSVGSRLTRYVISGDFTVTTRDKASFASARRGPVVPRSRVSGTLVSADWMRLDDGRHLSTALLATSPTVRAFNGRLPASRLTALPNYLNTSLSGTRTLARIAATQFLAMDTAFTKRFGYHVTVNEGYRPLSWQQYWYGQYGAPRAAYPGTSNHGMGLAVDIRSGAGSPFTFGSAADRWLSDNGAAYGWDRPWWLDPGHGNPEYWHYNFVG